MYVSPLALVGVLVALACSACARPSRGSTPAPMTGIVFGDSTGGDESGSATDGDESTTEDDAAGTSSTDAATGDASGQPATSGNPAGGICTPIENDAECPACSKANCCAQLEACSADAACGCYMMCVATSADIFGCGTECGVNPFAPGPVGDLVACSSGPCAEACT